MLPSGFLGYPWAELIVITGGNTLMENYRKVHLREVLINNTSRLRYSVQPEECGLSHSCWTKRVSVPLSQAGKWLPQPPKAILDFRCNQRSRSTLKLKNSDKGETKSVWPIQLASLPDLVSASKLSGDLQSLRSQSQSRKLHNLQMEKRRQKMDNSGITAQMPPQTQRDVPHTCEPERKLIKTQAN